MPFGCETLAGDQNMRRTIESAAIATDTAPIIDDGCDDRRKGPAEGYPAREPRPDRRQSQRQRVLLGALIVDLARETIVNCRAENASDGGARLRLSDPQFVPATFWLIALSSGLAYQATVKWRRDDRLGVSFEESIDLEDPESAVARKLQKIWQSRR